MLVPCSLSFWIFTLMEHHSATSTWVDSPSRTGSSCWCLTCFFMDSWPSTWTMCCPVSLGHHLTLWCMGDVAGTFKSLISEHIKLMEFMSIFFVKLLSGECRVGVNSIPELELQLNSNSNSGIGIGIGIEISGIENGIGIEIPGIGIGIGIENRNWFFCNCYRSTY